MYQECEIEFLEQKRFPSKEAGKYHSSTKNIIQINIKSFEEVPIHHTKTKHKTDIKSLVENYSGLRAQGKQLSC